jgi:hypothetical protein
MNNKSLSGFWRTTPLAAIYAAGGFLSLAGDFAKDLSSDGKGHGQFPIAGGLAFEEADAVNMDSIVIDKLGAHGSATVVIGGLHQVDDDDDLINFQSFDQSGGIQGIKMGSLGAGDIIDEIVGHLIFIWEARDNLKVILDRVVMAIAAIVDQGAIGTSGQVWDGAIRWFHGYSFLRVYHARPG